jgi:hypothetical protein
VISIYLNPTPTPPPHTPLPLPSLRPFLSISLLLPPPPLLFGSLSALGGRQTLGNLLFFQHNRWATVQPAGNSPRARSGHGLVCGADEKLYLFGGFDGEKLSSAADIVLRKGKFRVEHLSLLQGCSHFGATFSSSTHQTTLGRRLLV